MQEKTKNREMPKWLPMASLIFVILMWGSTPVVHKKMYAFYSPTVYSTLMALIAGIALLLLSIKKLHLIDKKLLSIAIPTGFINALAAFTQKIGLHYTTPTKCSFLDTLSCVAVPIMLLILTRKIPSIWKFVASILCLCGCFVLTGVSFTDFSAFGIGEILCATAGILYGVNIALTGLYAKDVYVPLHVTIHMGVQVVTGSIIATVLNFVTVDGVPIEKFKISFEPLPLLVMLFMGLIATALGWIIRINVLKKIDPTVVGVMMPMSSLVTGFVSVLSGSDVLSVRLVVGAILGVSASLVSNLAKDKRETAKTDTYPDENAKETQQAPTSADTGCDTACEQQGSNEANNQTQNTEQMHTAEAVVQGTTDTDG